MSLEPAVTVAVVPRERFSFAERALAALYERTRAPFDLVYVDGNAPRPVARALRAAAVQWGFRLLRTEEYLTPNEARNLVIPHVTTRYVAFLDNDVLVRPGWLTALVDCAEETGAGVVGPLYCFGLRECETVHLAGGDARVVETADGRRHFFERHRHANQPLAAVRSRARREATEQAEFHCMLVRTDLFARLGKLDEGLRSSREHVDFCMQVRAAGETVYSEPAAVVTYITPRVLPLSDLGYFWRRWSTAWNRASLDHFKTKWGLSDDDPSYADQFWWLERHRRHALRPLRLWVRRLLLGRERGRRFAHAVLYPLEARFNRWLTRNDPRFRPSPPTPAVAVPGG